MQQEAGIKWWPLLLTKREPSRVSHLLWLWCLLPNYVSFLLPRNNEHKLRSLKQHPYVSSQLCGQKPGHSMTAFSAHDLTKLPSMCQPSCFPIVFQATWLCSNSVLCGCRPVFPVCLLVLSRDTVNSCWLPAFLTTWPPPCPKPDVEHLSCAKPHSCPRYLSRRSPVPFKDSPD